jgi:PAB-dependent poly(A)-specific ribonuclease subunit 2
VTALAFDPVSDLLWAGSSSGHVFSTSNAHDVREICFPIGCNSGVRKIMVDEKYVRAIGIEGNSMGSWHKGGMNKWYYQ